MHTYTPADSIFDGPVTNLLSVQSILIELFSRAPGGKLNDFKFGTYFCLFSEWWRGKHGSERVKFVHACVNCIGCIPKPCCYLCKKAYQPHMPKANWSAATLMGISCNSYDAFSVLKGTLCTPCGMSFDLRYTVHPLWYISWCKVHSAPFLAHPLTYSTMSTHPGLFPDIGYILHLLCPTLWLTVQCAPIVVHYLTQVHCAPLVSHPLTYSTVCTHCGTLSDLGTLCTSCSTSCDL